MIFALFALLYPAKFGVMNEEYGAVFEGGIWGDKESCFSREIIAQNACFYLKIKC